MTEASERNELTELLRELAAVEDHPDHQAATADELQALPDTDATARIVMLKQRIGYLRARLDEK